MLKRLDFEKVAQIFSNSLSFRAYLIQLPFLQKSIALVFLLNSLLFLHGFELAKIYDDISRYSTYSYNSTHFIIASCISIVYGVFLLLPYKSSFLYAVEVAFAQFLLPANLLFYIFINASGWITISIVLLLLCLRIVGFSEQWRSDITINVPLNVLAVLIFLMLIPFVYTFGTQISSKVFSLDVTVKEQVKVLARTLSNPYTGYTINLLYTFLIPYLLLEGIKSKKYIFVAFAILFQVYLFTTSSASLILLSLPLFIVFYFFEKVEQKMLLFLVSISLIFTLYALTKNFQVEVFLIKRLFFTPALVCNYYFDFFEGRPIYYADSFMRHFIPYPYPQSPGFLITTHYYEPGPMNSASGFPSEGFMNLGKIGVFLLPIFISLFYKYIEPIFSKNTYLFGIVIFTVFTLISGPLATSILSYGFWLLLLIPTLPSHKYI